MSSLKYVDICLSGDDSRDSKRMSALRDSRAATCVANSSVVEGLNLDPIGQIQLRPYCGNTVTADLVCLNTSLHDSDEPPSQHIHMGPTWGPHRLPHGAHMGRPIGSQQLLATGSTWGPCGLPICGPHMGPT